MPWQFAWKRVAIIPRENEKDYSRIFDGIYCEKRVFLILRSYFMKVVKTKPGQFFQNFPNFLTEHHF